MIKIYDNLDDSKTKNVLMGYDLNGKIIEPAQLKSLNRIMLVEVVLDNVYSQEDLKTSIEKVKEVQNSIEDIQITLKINMQ